MKAHIIDTNGKSDRRAYCGRLPPFQIPAVVFEEYRRIQSEEGTENVVCGACRRRADMLLAWDF